MNISELIQAETEYQQKQLKLIPSENYVSKAVMEAVGSVFINKYAEGQAGKRYYQGNRNVDAVEKLCKGRALELFNLTKTPWSVNVQALTGAIANLAVYSAVLKPGEKMLAMYLPAGGHLSHGWKLPNGKPVSFTAQIFDSHFYNVSPQTHQLDYEEIASIVKEVRPRLVITGGTAYPRAINFEKMAEIAHSVGALYLADSAHEAGLIAGEAYASPFDHADIVTMTTRKTLRGPIGALIFSANPEIAQKIDKAVFPGLQGGPMINSIAGISVALEEARQPKFKQHARQMVKNAAALAEKLKDLGFKLLTDGTDTHLILIDITNKQPDGLIAAEMLEHTDIITNKNTIPAEPKGNNHIPPWRPAGLRIGTPAVTTRGMKEKDMKEIARLMDQALSIRRFDDSASLETIRAEMNELHGLDEIKQNVHSLTAKFPIYTQV